MEHLYMTLGFHVKRFFHGAPIYQHWDIAVQDINLLLGITHHALCCPDTAKTDDDAAYKEETANNHHQLYFVFKVLDNHNFMNLMFVTILR